MAAETRQVEVAGKTVTIRPIRPDDAGMERDFLHRLSPEAKHYRFLGAVRELPAPELERLCNVDGENTMAFVATLAGSDGETEIGVGRYAPGGGEDAREMALTVADDWRGTGLDAELVRVLIEHARARGVKRLFFVELADNSTIRKLAKTLGMHASRHPDDVHQVVYSMAIGEDAPAAP